MKSSETLVPCPACGVMTSRDFMSFHISRMKQLEGKSNAQREKVHLNYGYSLLKAEQIIRSNNYEEKNRSRS